MVLSTDVHAVASDVGLSEKTIHVSCIQCNAFKYMDQVRQEAVYNRICMQAQNKIAIKIRYSEGVFLWGP